MATWLLRALAGATLVFGVIVYGGDGRFFAAGVKGMDPYKASGDASANSSAFLGGTRYCGDEKTACSDASANSSVF